MVGEVAPRSSRCSRRTKLGPRRCRPPRGGRRSRRSRPGSACAQRQGLPPASTAHGWASPARTRGSTLRPRAFQPRRGRARPPSEGCHRGAETSCVPPARGPKLKSPCHASAFSNDQGFPSKTKVRCRNCGRCGDRRPKLFKRQRAVGKCLSDHFTKARPVRWRQAVVALPAREFPHSTGCPQGKVGAAVLRRHQVRGASKRERLDDPPVLQGASDLARPGSLTSGTDGELGGGIELSLDGAQPAHDRFDRCGTDRFEQLLPHPPGEGLGPAD